MIDPRVPMMVQQPNVLAALDAGTTAATNQNALMRQAEGQNIFRQFGADAMGGDRNALAQIAGFDPVMAQGMQSERLNQQAAGLRMELTREHIAQARREAAAAAASVEDARLAKEELERGKGYMRFLGQAFLTGDQDTWDVVTSELGVSGIPMNESGLQFVDGILTGFEEGLSGIVPQPDKGPLSPQGKLAADLQAGRITQEQFDAANTKQPLVSVTTGSEIGTIPQGYEVFTTPEGTRRMRPIEGGPAAQEAAAMEDKEFGRQVQRARAGSTVIQDLQRALDLLPQLGPLAQNTGVIGGLARSLGSNVPGSTLFQIQEFTESALSNVGLDTLQQMRENSPTGGALGQVPIQQQQRLEQVLGSLKNTQRPDVLDANIKRVINIYTDIIFGSPEERARAVAEGRMSRQQSDEIDGFYYDLPFDERGRRVDAPQGPRPPGQGAVPIDPPRAAISLLQSDPSPEAQIEFDQAFGEGAAARALGQ